MEKTRSSIFPFILFRGFSFGDIRTSNGDFCPIIIFLEKAGILSAISAGNIH